MGGGESKPNNQTKSNNTQPKPNTNTKTDQKQGKTKVTLVSSRGEFEKFIKASFLSEKNCSFDN